MALLEVHPWVRFVAGMFTGCWIGGAIACAGVLLLVGRRVRHLEDINLLLRAKLKAREKPQRTGTGGGGGPIVVMPLPGASHKPERQAGRIARVN